MKSKSKVHHSGKKEGITDRLLENEETAGAPKTFHPDDERGPRVHWINK